MVMGAGVARTTIEALANSPHCVHSPQLRMRTSYTRPGDPKPMIITSAFNLFAFMPRL